VHGWHAIVEHIDSSEIHLWLAYPDEIKDPRLLAEYWRLLSGEELQRQQRFYFERDRHRYLVTRAMVRTVLSRYAGVAPRDWEFVVNAYGRPSIAAKLAATRWLEFNVSHSQDLVIMGIARARAIGVDVESVLPQRAALEVADRFFAPAEVAALRALPSEQQHRRFFDYWTLKESYVKARGMGLSIALDRFAFHIEDPTRIWLAIDPTLGDQAGRWTFWQLQSGRDYRGAVCAERRGEERLELSTMRSWLSPESCTSVTARPIRHRSTGRRP
jgi:4'-phosphopantetheinyl transferase